MSLASKEAAWWSVLWVSLALIFGGVVSFVLLRPRGDRGDGIHDSLANGEEPFSRQPLRLRADLRLFQGAPGISAPGAVLRRRRRSGIPSHLPDARLRGREPLHLRAVPLRRDSLLQRLQNPQGRGRQLRPGQEFRGAHAAEDHAGPGRVRGHALRHQEGGEAGRNSAARGGRRDRGGRPALRRRQRARRAGRSATTPSSSTPATRSPSWGCGLCTSCWRGCWTAFTTRAWAWRSFWPSSPSSSSFKPRTR